MSGIDNLTPFEPGNPGGPGRPKGSRGVASVMRELLAGLDPKDARWESPIAKKLIQIAFGKGADGEPLANTDQQIKALREMLDRIEGKAVQKTETELTVPQPIRVTFGDGADGNDVSE